ncbi:hypothetical protein Tco_0776165 [Tanacetum coccineum]
MEIDRRFEEVLRPLKPIPLVGIGEPEGSDDYIEVPFDDEQILRQHNIAHVTPHAYTESLHFLTTMEPATTLLMGDGVISTTLAKENDEFIKSSVDDLVPIPRESEVTSDNINLPLGEPLDTLSTGNKEIDFNPSRDIEEIERLLADDPVLVPRVFDDPLGITIQRVTFYFFEQLLNEDTSSDVSPVLLPTESSSLDLPPRAFKQFSLREVERFDHFFPDTVGWEDEGDGDPFFWFSSYAITPSCCILTNGGDVLLLPSPPHIG